MAHSVVPEADAILDQEVRVLDKGFVRLVDYMGSDDRIVQSARVSYGKGTKTVREDRGLINYLMRNRHTSPFEQVILTFHTKMPIFVARQWVRHRTARLNEISGRYSVMEDEFYVPESDEISAQAVDNKQGRDSAPLPPDLAEHVQAQLVEGQRSGYEAYEALLDTGLARELARINLPLSLYTQWYWQVDLHNLFHFLELRLDSHAQYEIRAYAEVMFDMAGKVAPIATEAFREHVLGGTCLSAREYEVVKALAAGVGFDEAAERAGLTGKRLERLKAKLF
ncbi:MAG: FAD-dependent thymidylate synthase [Spirochaetales bacterium]